jgi:hypothetical protein
MSKKTVNTKAKEQTNVWTTSFVPSALPMVKFSMVRGRNGGSFFIAYRRRTKKYKTNSSRRGKTKKAKEENQEAGSTTSCSSREALINTDKRRNGTQHTQFDVWEKHTCPNIWRGRPGADRKGTAKRSIRRGGGREREKTTIIKYAYKIEVLRESREEERKTDTKETCERWKDIYVIQEID